MSKAMRSWTSVGAIALASLLPVQTAQATDGFDIVVLGALGGIQDGNLSAYLIHPHDDTRAVLLDVGTLVNGLHVLAEKAKRDALKDLPVVITHIKYALTREQPQKRMMDELQAQNDLGVRFLLPEQGTRWHFK